VVPGRAASRLRRTNTHPPLAAPPTAPARDSFECILDVAHSLQNRAHDGSWNPCHTGGCDLRRYENPPLMNCMAGERLDGVGRWWWWRRRCGRSPFCESDGGGRVLSVRGVTICRERFQSGTPGLKGLVFFWIAWRGPRRAALPRHYPRHVFRFSTAGLWHPTLRLQSQSAIIAEAGTVSRDRIWPVVGICQRDTASKFFDIKILPASDCAPWIIWRFHANSMIPVDHGGLGYPSQAQPVHSRNIESKL